MKASQAFLCIGICIASHLIDIIDIQMGSVFQVQQVISLACSQLVDKGGKHISLILLAHPGSFAAVADIVAYLSIDNLHTLGVDAGDQILSPQAPTVVQIKI